MILMQTVIQKNVYKDVYQLSITLIHSKKDNAISEKRENFSST